MSLSSMEEKLPEIVYASNRLLRVVDTIVSVHAFHLFD